MARPRQKGMRKAYLNRFRSDVVKIKSTVNQVKMDENPLFNYNKHAASIGATHMHEIETVEVQERIHDKDANGKDVFYEVTRQKQVTTVSKLSGDPAMPHQAVYTRGKGNEWDASIPRVWTIAKLYQGTLRQQQNVRFNYVDLLLHKNGGIRKYFAIGAVFFVEIDSLRKIERRSKLYTNDARAMAAFRMGTIRWIKTN